MRSALGIQLMAGGWLALAAGCCCSRVTSLLLLFINAASWAPAEEGRLLLVRGLPPVRVTSLFFQRRELAAESSRGSGRVYPQRPPPAMVACCRDEETMPMGVVVWRRGWRGRGGRTTAKAAPAPEQ